MRGSTASTASVKAKVGSTPIMSWCPSSDGTTAPTNLSFSELLGQMLSDVKRVTVTEHQRILAEQAAEIRTRQNANGMSQAESITDDENGLLPGVPNCEGGMSTASTAHVPGVEVKKDAASDLVVAFDSKDQDCDASHSNGEDPPVLHENVEKRNRGTCISDYGQEFHVCECWERGQGGAVDKNILGMRKGNESNNPTRFNQVTGDRGEQSTSSESTQQAMERMITQAMPFGTSGFDTSKIRKWWRSFLRPGSMLRLPWDLIGFLLIGYDSIMVPFMLMNPPVTTGMLAFLWLARVYWPMDLVLSFFTGYVLTDGRIESDPFKIVKRYLKSWFFFDLVVVCAEWTEVVVTLMGDSATDYNATKGLRTIRVIRALRLLRLIRVALVAPQTQGKLSMLVRSEEVLTALGIVKIIAMVSTLIHVIACGWYAMGDSQDGWVHHYKYSEEHLGYQYAVAYHWALAAFTSSSEVYAQTYSERCYTDLVLMIAFITAGIVVSSITTSMTRLQIVTATYSKQLYLLRRYLIENNIPTGLAFRVESNAKYMIAQQKNNLPEHSVHLLQMISEPLKMEVHYQLHGSTLEFHPFFERYNDLNQMAFRQVCHRAASRQRLHEGDILFTEGEVAATPKMYFVISGKLVYHKQGASQAMVLSSGCWAGEPPLWISNWMHLGDLRSTGSEVIIVDALLFQRVAVQFRAKEFYPAMYANAFLYRMNHSDPDQISDLHDECLDVFDLCDDTFEGLGERVRSSTRSLGRTSMNHDQTRLAMRFTGIMHGHNAVGDSGRPTTRHRPTTRMVTNQACWWQVEERGNHPVDMEAAASISS